MTRRIFAETDRLFLREISAQDFDALKPILSDPDVMYAWEHGFSDDEIRAWIERREKGYCDNGFDYFLAVDKTTGAPIGQIGLLKETLGSETLYGIGWILKRDRWGNGYAAEGARAVMDYAFRLLNLPELVADIRPENLRSRRVAERLGMRETNVVIKIVGDQKMPHIVYRIKNPYRVYCNFRAPLDTEHYPADAKKELRRMVERDRDVRERLAASGALSQAGYCPDMEAVHVYNSLRLEDLVDAYGYPTLDVAGLDAADDAWLILQHAIGRPALLRAALAFYGTLNGYQLSPASFAYLYDRVAFYERRPQRYGTQFDYGLDGTFGIWTTESPEALSMRRRAVGLPPVDDVKARLIGEGAAAKIAQSDAFRKRVMQEKWLLNVGWCTMAQLQQSRKFNF